MDESVPLQRRAAVFSPSPKESYDERVCVCVSVPMRAWRGSAVTSVPLLSTQACCQMASAAGSCTLLPVAAGRGIWPVPRTARRRGSPWPSPRCSARSAGGRPEAARGTRPGPRRRCCWPCASSRCRTGRPSPRTRSRTASRACGRDRLRGRGRSAKTDNGQ